MNHMLITIAYTLPGHPPAMTTTVVPIESNMTFETRKRQIQQEYRNKPYYQVTITLV